MQGDDSAGEDEGTALQRRFSREGLDWGSVEPSERAVHVWRWLVDGEANLRAARHINDKLRRQHEEEKMELQQYAHHLRCEHEERVRGLEEEVGALKEDLEALLAGTQAVSTMLEGEGLHDVAQTSLGEQIAYMLVERKKLIEELSLAHSTHPGAEREKDLTAQLIKACTELEVLRHKHQETEAQLGEMHDRVQLLERASRQLETDNETLAFKLSEALAEIEDNEGQLRRLKNPHFRRGESQRSSLRSLEDAATPGHRSLPEAPPPPLHRRESSRSSGRRRKLSGSRRSSVCGSVSPSRHPSLPDPHSKATAMQEHRKLQEEVEQVRQSLLEVGDKCEAAVVKYEVYKIKTKGRIHALKSDYKSELEALQRRVSQLEAEVALKGDQLRAEDVLRRQLEDDLGKIRAERQEMAGRVRESERTSQEQVREVALLQERVNLLKEENNRLGERLQDLSVAAIVG